VRLPLAALVTLLGSLLVVGTACGSAQAFESFTLEEHDKLIAEAPGCYADCRIVGTRRICTIRETECRAVCQAIPECRPDGTHMLKACVVLKSQR
jgi:hypothetical protein